MVVEMENGMSWDSRTREKEHVPGEGVCPGLSSCLREEKEGDDRTQERS